MTANVLGKNIPGHEDMSLKPGLAFWKVWFSFSIAMLWIKKKKPWFADRIRFFLLSNILEVKLKKAYLRHMHIYE